MKYNLKGGTPLYGRIKLRIDEPSIIYPDIFFAKKHLKWRPKTSFFNGLKKTISYFKINN